MLDMLLDPILSFDACIDHAMNSRNFPLLSLVIEVVIDTEQEVNDPIENPSGNAPVQNSAEDYDVEYVLVQLLVEYSEFLDHRIVAFAFDSIQHCSLVVHVVLVKPNKSRLEDWPTVVQAQISSSCSLW